nr:uncharacterized mitochondrial protein AtMg00810-like [Tanacetum cinerariifolium]
MVEKSKMDKDKEEKAVDSSHYRGMIGTFLYLTASRPDLQFGICMCARYQARPTKKHIHAVKRIFRYLRGTVNRGLWYPKDSSVALTAFADADHAGYQDTRRSTYGSLQFLGESLISWIPVLNQSSTEYYEEEEKIDDEEKIDEEEDDEFTKELYNDVNVNLGNRDANMTDSDQGGTDQQNKIDEPVQSSFGSPEFTSKLLNLENPSLADNEIASLMDTTTHHEEPRSQTSSLYTIPVTTTPEVTSISTTTILSPPLFFNPLPQQTTPTPTPTTFNATTSFPSLPDFLYVFKFNDRVTNLEKDMSEIKQVDQYTQALSSIPAIIYRYINSKLGEPIQRAIMAYNLDCREEAQAEKEDYIELVDPSMRAILKKEVNTQLPQILPQGVSNFTIAVIEKNITESLEAAVLARSSSQTKSTYEAVVFTLKRSRNDRDKDQDPSTRSDRRTKRRKSSKEAESSRDLRSKKNKSSSTSKDTSHSQHKPYDKSSHAEKPIHTVDDSGVQQDQEFDTGNNDEQPADKEVSKAD